MVILLIFAFLAGIATALSPCILPILPAILSSSAMQGRLRPIGIVIGLVISFTLFTLTFTSIVHAFGISADTFRYIAIMLIASFGLIMLIPRLSTWFSAFTQPIATIGTRLQTTTTGTGLWSGLVFGFALGLIWTPCAGPILAAVTTLVATQSISFSVVLITLVYSIGAGIPMLLIAYGGKRVIQSSHYLSSHSEGIRQCFGVLLLLTAVTIAFHWDMVIQRQVSRFVPALIIEDIPIVKSELGNLYAETSSTGPSIEQSRTGKLGNFGKAPEFVGIVNWINSRPLSIQQLRGKVVLIDFWTYSCINCLRTLPYLEDWYAKYKDKGLVIVGVHTPEFEFEKDAQNVAEAATTLGVHYPIAQDNDYKTWKAYNNHYWPAHYLIDQNGTIRMVHFGEGGYAEMENAIRELLSMPPIEISEPVTSKRPLTSEIYLGVKRSQHYAMQTHPDEIWNYEKTATLPSDAVALTGLWEVEDERITAKSDESVLNLNFQARRVYLVLSGSSRVPLEVYLDGKLITTIHVHGDRKYDIVKTEYGRHELILKIPPNVSAYAFTFGDEE